MKPLRPIALCAVVMVLSTPVVRAQTCSSFASFDLKWSRLSGGASFSDMRYRLGAGLSMGGSGIFGGFRLNVSRPDEQDGHSVGGSANGGYQFALDKKGLVQLCPLLAVSRTSFSNGVAVGIVAAENGQVRLIPSATIEGVYFRETLEDQTTVSEAWANVRLKLGLVFNETVTFRSHLNVPFGLSDGKASFGVSLGVNLVSR